MRNSRKEYGHLYSELSESEKDEFIDEDIKDLVKVINSVKGIETRFSCSGHGEEGYVMFVGKEKSVKFILSRLPNDFSFGDSHFRVTASCYKGEIRYCIRFFAQDPVLHKHLIDSLVLFLKTGKPFIMDLSPPV